MTEGTTMPADDYQVIYLAPKCFDERPWCEHDAPEECECDDGPHDWIKFTRTTSLAAQDGLVERVARAMYEDRASECANPIPWDCTSSQDIWFKQARAALASIEVKSS